MIVDLFVGEVMFSFWKKFRGRRARHYRRMISELRLLNDSLLFISRAPAVGPDSIFSFAMMGEDVSLFLPNFRFDVIQGSIVKKGDFFEGELLRYIKGKYISKISKPKVTVADVGGNIGNHAVFFGKFCNAEVFTFEPQRNVFRILEKNVTLNNVDVHAYNVALGCSDGYADFEQYTPTNIGATRLKATSVPSGMEIKTLDSYKIHPDFIKIDVEGFESFVLRGAMQTIRNARPIIWIEIFPENRGRVFSILGEMGYELVEDLGDSNFIFRYK